MRSALTLLVTLTLGAALAPSAAWAGTCDDFASAPAADAEDPLVKKAVAVWARVAAPFELMTGRQTALTVLAASATRGEGDQAQAFPPTGHICPGAPPTVYVTWPLLKRVYTDGAYPEDFLAFVLSHELGHRVNDLTPAGSLLGKDERPGKGRSEEPLADKRAAFFAASAGFSMRKLATEEIVSAFLSDEVHVHRGAVAARQKTLMATLRRFDAFEDLYQAGLVLMARDDTEAALRLIASADEHVSDGGVPLPELKAIHAIALMNAAAPHAPWLAPHAARLPLGELRCEVVFPTHSALAQDPDPTSLRGGDDEAAQALAKKRLARAKSLLDDAEAFGLNALVLTNARACHALYTGDLDAATSGLKSAQKIAAKAPQPVRDVLASDLALAQFAAFLKKRPAPASSAAKKSRAWTKKLEKATRKLTTKNTQLASLVPRLLAYPDVPDAAAGLARPPACGEGDAPPKPPEVPELSGKLGECPDGWMLAHSIPELDAADDAGTSLGFTVCQPASFGPVHDRLFSIRLPGATSPPLSPVEVDMFVRDVPADAAAPLDQWTCSGNSAQRRGTSDTGQTITMFTRAALDVFDALAFSMPSGLVHRLVFFAE